MLAGLRLVRELDVKGLAMTGLVSEIADPYPSATIHQIVSQRVVYDPAGAVG
jgi:hypothetical protein